MQVRSPIFDTVSKNNTFNFRDKKGKLQYNRIVATLGFSKKEISGAVRVPINTIQYEEDQIPNKIKDFLDQINCLFSILDKHFKDKDKALQWINTPNVVFGDMSPKDMLLMGQYKKLNRVVFSYIEGDLP